MITKNRFENMPSEEKTLQPHQQRVVTEKTELDDKIVKLGVFLSSEKFKELDAAECSRLTRQYQVMREYSTILGARIKAFTP